jgi:hypothetical protein
VVAATATTSASVIVVPLVLRLLLLYYVDDLVGYAQVLDLLLVSLGSWEDCRAGKWGAYVVALYVNFWESEELVAFLGLSQYAVSQGRQRTLCATVIRGTTRATM